MSTVIVTGGTRGIGLEIAREFYSAGWSVIVGARNQPEKLEADLARLKGMM